MSSDKECSDDAAKKMLDQIEAVYVPEHEFVDVKPMDFPHVDMDFYEDATLWLSGRSCRHLGDIMNKTLEDAPGNLFKPVMIRVLISRDGAVMASMFDVRIRPWWARLLIWLLRKSPGKIIDMETEFSDGAFVTTTNGIGASGVSLPSLIHAEFHPAKTGVDTLFHRHRERVDAYARKHPNASAVVIETLEDVHASQNRMNALKAAYRGEIGGITKEELERVAGGRYQTVDDLHTSIVEEQERRDLENE
jgi:hypothetical protein